MSIITVIRTNEKVPAVELTQRAGTSNEVFDLTGKLLGFQASQFFCIRDLSASSNPVSHVPPLFVLCPRIIRTVQVVGVKV